MPILSEKTRISTAGSVAIIVFAGLYTALHLLSLRGHPFVHSDEAWLASLTRAMIEERSIAAVEESFRLTLRYPHALKTLYHIVQMPFLSVGWSAFYARIPSLLAGGAVLVMMLRIAAAMGLKRSLAFLPALLMSLDPQFWYLAHLGRQEMLLIFLFTWSWYLKEDERPGWLVALPLASGIFVHPNIFVMALGIGILYLPAILKQKETRVLTDGRGRFSDVMSYTLTLALSAGLAVGISYLMDPHFLKHYFNFGDSVGTGDSLAVKFLGLPRFLAKMARRQAGTYYLAEVRFFYGAGLAGILLILSGLSAGKKRNRRMALSIKTARGKVVGWLLVIPALLSGMVLIGKYGPPTIGFLMVPSYLLLALGMSAWLPLHPPGTALKTRRSKIVKKVVASLFFLAALCTGYTTYTEVRRSLDRKSYDEYRDLLSSVIGSEGRILMNFNGAFAFDYDRLLIWRDLDSLAPETTLAEYLDEQMVQWIVVPEELGLIYDARPVWNGLYGNPGWFPDLQLYLEEKGHLVAEESFPTYAMRIVPYMNRDDWMLRIYRIQ